MGIGTLGGGDFFQVGLENFLYKNSEYESQQKNDYKCSFYNFSLLVPYPNNFLVVCICILIFHGIYSPPSQPTNIFLWRAKNLLFDLYLGAWKNSNFLGPFRLGGTLFLFWQRGVRSFSSIKPSMTNHVNSRTVDDKIICFMCACQLFTLLLGNFLFENFLSVQMSIETLEKMFIIVW